MLSVDPSGLTLHPLTLGSSSSLDVGDEVAAIGDPFTYERSMSTGIVSGLDRTISAPNGFTVAHAIQTDAALNPGNSGGPVLDAGGQGHRHRRPDRHQRLLGHQLRRRLRRPDRPRQVRAVPARGGRTVSHAYLGVSTSTADTSPGALVQSVTSGGPADNAGLRAGDIVTALGDTTIKGTNDLVATIADARPGDRVAATVRRGSQTIKVTVTLGTQPSQPTLVGIGGAAP